MKIHKEGRNPLFILAASLLFLNFCVFRFYPAAQLFAGGASLALFGFVLWFFRNPERIIIQTTEQFIMAPADGRVVVIEKTDEPEYFGDDRLQVSIFMSVTDVHLNRVPISGEVSYYKYHPGRYLVAWHPKSSTDNERSTVVIRSGETEILLRQIAGALARRIRTYLDTGQRVIQGEELGFIKFGSRVDILLPLNASVKVKLGQKVKGNKTIIAEIPTEPAGHRSARRFVKKTDDEVFS